MRYKLTRQYAIQRGFDSLPVEVVNGNSAQTTLKIVCTVNYKKLKYGVILKYKIIHDTFRVYIFLP